MRNDAGPGPILIASLGILSLSVMDGLIKQVSAGYPTAVIVFMRFLFGALCGTIIYVVLGAPRVDAQALRLALIRGVFIVSSAGLFFAGLGRLPLVDAIALSFLAPIVIAIFGRLFLGEAIGRGAALGILLGSVGVAVMLADQLAGSGNRTRDLVGAAFILASTLTYGISIIILRRQATRDPLPVLVLLQNWIPALYILPLAGLQWVTPQTPDLTLFAAMGLLGAIGHVALTWAFARANAARIGVVEYTALVWGALIGYLWFGEVPTLATLAGAVMIIGGALAVSWTPRPSAPATA